jgi:hypothetical protein
MGVHAYVPSIAVLLLASNKRGYMYGPRFHIPAQNRFPESH